MSTEDEILILKCLNCNKNRKKHFNLDLIKIFANKYESCDGDINRFCLMLRKGVYSYEYMDSWKKFDETLLPDKEDFYSNLSMEDITDVDYNHEKKKHSNTLKKNLGCHHDLYVQSDTLLLTDVFENFRNEHIEIYELDPAHLLSAPGLNGKHV